MSLPSNEITAEVIREIMPLDQLSDDLLQATFAALAPPPRDTSTAWRHARIARLTQEISTLTPANAPQTRQAADILMVREMARSIVARVHAPEPMMPEMSRVGRVAGVLVRTLERGRQKLAPFFGTVLADAVDVAAPDTAWGRNSTQREAAGDPKDLTAETPGAAVAGITPGTTASPGEPPGHAPESSSGRAQAAMGQGRSTMEEGMGTVGLGTVMGMRMRMRTGMGREINGITAVQPPASGLGPVRPGPDERGGDTTLETPAELSDVAVRFIHDAGGRPETRSAVSRINTLRVNRPAACLMQACATQQSAATEPGTLESGTLGPGTGYDTVGPEPCGAGCEAGSWRRGNPRGNPGLNLAPRCGVRARSGEPCRAPAMATGRCRMHGGTSTGPRPRREWRGWRLRARCTDCRRCPSGRGG